MNIKPRWVTALAARRAAAVAGVAGLALGAAMLTGGSAAMAANGSEPGNLTLNPPSGPLSTLPTWSTSDACPSGFQGSAQLFEFNTDGSFASSISQVQLTGTQPFTNVNVLTGGTIEALLGVTNITPGATVEFAVECAASPDLVGATEYVQSTFLTESADGTSYTTSASGPAQGTATSTALAVSPSPASSGDTVTLTATVTAADGSHPAGSVQFETGGTDVGDAVAVDANGAASTTTTAGAPGTEQFQAVFTPTDTTGFAGSTGSASLVVNPAGAQAAGTVPLTVTVPQTGTLTVTVGEGTVNLAVQGSTSPLSATGTLNTVTVSDTRNFAPGWSASGQLGGDFEGGDSAAGHSIPADQLGWAPTAVDPLVGNATLGQVVAPGASPGLGDAAQVLASATAGNGLGTNMLSAALTLSIPDSAVAGPYTDNLTITYLLSN